MDNRELAEQLEKILRLDTMPVAMKFYEDRKDLPREPLNFKLNLCQLVSMARYPVSYTHLFVAKKELDLILETEKKAETEIEEARSKARELLDKADKKAEEISTESAKKAEARAAEMVEKATKNADLALESAVKEAQEAIDRVKASASQEFEGAVQLVIERIKKAV